MRYILVLALLIILPTSAFTQSKTVEKADIETVAECFPKAVIITFSERFDPLIIVKPPEKLDSGMLVEILCSGEFLINRNAETFPSTIAPETNKKP